ncbi:MAG: 9-O-acetylesterase [Lentisphaeraceae bacterium]|nr:9-O-acetylesterase [Lentisphaeraceae bacterium]
MKTLLLLLLLSAQASLMATIQLPSLFKHGAILQRDTQVPVWGWTAQNTDVSVSFKGQKKSTRSDSRGKWMIRLDPMKASSEGAVMKIQTVSESTSIKDILVGEVWLCGGQSNMDFTLKSISLEVINPKYQPIADYIKNEMATAVDPLLRRIKVSRSHSAFGQIDNFNVSWQEVGPKGTAHFSATAYFFARELRRKLNIPIGIINCSWSGTRIEPWIPLQAFKSNKKLKCYYEKEILSLKRDLAQYDALTEEITFGDKMIAWEENQQKAKADGTRVPPQPALKIDPLDSNKIPSTLYNGMIHSLIPYALKGAIWYQGESNERYFADQYKERFSALINGWRQAWGQQKFYFFWCQLASYRKASKKPLNNNGWATICDQQRLTLELPDTGMAVLNDIGDEIDIHPENKIDAGKRLSLWALKKAYNQHLVHSGPLYESSKVHGNKIIVNFTNVGSGLMVATKNLMEPARASTDALKCFQMRGADNIWRWADAKISGSNTVEVSHQEITHPQEVRYAWASNPEGANLYNKEGLPASLFKTK